MDLIVERKIDDERCRKLRDLQASQLKLLMMINRTVSLNAEP